MYRKNDVGIAEPLLRAVGASTRFARGLPMDTCVRAVRALAQSVGTYSGTHAHLDHTVSTLVHTIAESPVQIEMWSGSVRVFGNSTTVVEIPPERVPYTELAQGHNMFRDAWTVAHGSSASPGWHGRGFRFNADAERRVDRSMILAALVEKVLHELWTMEVVWTSLLLVAESYMSLP